jgi:DNA-binding transcriptional ArsR family regulator
MADPADVARGIKLRTDIAAMLPPLLPGVLIPTAREIGDALSLPVKRAREHLDRVLREAGVTTALRRRGKGAIGARRMVVQPTSAIAEAAYYDNSYRARDCDRCGKSYQGPAVYCSLVCAVADA